MNGVEHQTCVDCNVEGLVEVLRGTELIEILAGIGEIADRHPSEMVDLLVQAYNAQMKITGIAVRPVWCSCSQHLIDELDLFLTRLALYCCMRLSLATSSASGIKVDTLLRMLDRYWLDVLISSVGIQRRLWSCGTSLDIAIWAFCRYGEKSNAKGSSCLTNTKLP